MLKRGFGRHARCLLRALVEVDRRNRYTFFIDAPEVASQLPGGIDIRVVAVTAPTIVAASAEGSRRVRDIVAMSRALSVRDLDTLLFPTLYSYVPTFGPARRIVIVHDATAEMYPELAIGNWKNRLLWSAKTALGCWQADVLVTVSEYSRNAIVERLGVAADRLHVVGEASDPVFRVLDDPTPTLRLRQLGFDGRGRSIVYLGGFSPHKNLARLVRVFERLSRAADLGDVHLWLVGDIEGESFVSCYNELMILVEALALTDRVTFTGFLPDDDAVAMLNLATVLVLPSLTEGLGLPAFEAAACGCPVIATTESPLPGLLGAGGRFVDPRDENALEHTVSAVLRSGSLRRQIRAAGLSAMAGMSWHASARRLRALIDDEPPRA